METAAFFTITVNGRAIEVRDVSPNENLLVFLRRSGLTGSKEGCAEGDCGACSVVLADRDAQGHPPGHASETFS